MSCYYCNTSSGLRPVSELDNRVKTGGEGTSAALPELRLVGVKGGEVGERIERIEGLATNSAS